MFVGIVAAFESDFVALFSRTLANATHNLNLYLPAMPVSTVPDFAYYQAFYFRILALLEPGDGGLRRRVPTGENTSRSEGEGVKAAY